ncbi:RNA degradosome polyphosphate kinase [Bacillaceae bacterium SIJ1]|uniref:RNA degradosome polyphosphate kinase n=1 Tax=Litoribacterium kuwaitense TaxID=1398745 RepID=UPI0013EC84F0|nr:RNA degradosome polyphosphate kinase [Litoribacterium kuwaitense]NGP46555.1 RNA degradosome polyphosphate kinase [Litoribacterium kuwaitense]
MAENKRLQLKDHAYYNNRELSWIAFNNRVLEEAEDPSNPLLERLRFLAIVTSNLDEFFMVRIAGLKDQIKAGFNQPENKAGLTPRQQLFLATEETANLVQRQYQIYQQLMHELQKYLGVKWLTYEELDNEQKEHVDGYFREHVFPVLTPLAVDAYRPFPHLLNNSINMVALLKAREGGLHYAIVQVPSVLKRFVFMPAKEGSYGLIMLENIIKAHIGQLFTGYTVEKITSFRITRNADLTFEEEGARDLLRVIEKEIQRRGRQEVVRMEVENDHMDESLLTFLIEENNNERRDVFFVNGTLDLTWLNSLYKELEPFYDKHVFPSLMPQHPKMLGRDEDIFEAVRDRDILLHHPYESFEPIIDFVERAAEDPNVLAIKQTLYRVSGKSPIIKGLKTAAANGKQVTVLVELKARFDEEKNVHWAKELEEAGCHVIYGMNHLKTHSKITLVVRHTNEGIERFVHLGTGNYNDQTARLYTDMGLLTSSPRIGEDATNFFNYLSGFTEAPSYHELSVAPFAIRRDLVYWIEKEIERHEKHGDGWIVMKVNSITDKELIVKLYEASCAGVRIDLIVRGICCLRPGIPNVSENIRVISIVGRFLEHTRIFYFHQGGQERLFLSSADMMTRNMEKRVEIMFPLYDEAIRKEMRACLDLMLSDNVKSRFQDQEGNYHRVPVEADDPLINSQIALFQRAIEAVRQETDE